MYEGLALFYDSFTRDIDYGAIARFAGKHILGCAAAKRALSRGERPIILDCGCGTGKLLDRLGDGFDRIGLDISYEMLNKARQDSGDGILWLCQDMCRMDLYGSVSAILSMTDSVNHILTAKRLAAFFARAHNFLDPGGVLIFDIVTRSRFGDGKNEFVCFDDNEDESCFWTGRFHPQSGLLKYDVSHFRLVDPERALYARTDDSVTEKIWDGGLILGMLGEAGFAPVKTYRAGRGGAPGGSTGKDRLYFVCVKGPRGRAPDADDHHTGE